MNTKKSNPTKLTFGDWISIANIVVVIIFGLISYIAIEKVKLSFEEAKNSREKTELAYLTMKVISDIRPKLTVKYSDYPIKKFSKQVGFTVTLKNNGLYHLFIKKPVFVLSNTSLQTRDGKTYPINYIIQDNDLKGGGQGIGPGEELPIEAMYFFKEEIDVTQLDGNFEMEIVTDPMVMNILQTIFPYKYDFSKIQKLPTYKIIEKVNYPTETKRNLDAMK